MLRHSCCNYTTFALTPLLLQFRYLRHTCSYAKLAVTPLTLYLQLRHLRYTCGYATYAILVVRPLTSHSQLRQLGAWLGSYATHAILTVTPNLQLRHTFVVMPLTPHTSLRQSGACLGSCATWARVAACNLFKAVFFIRNRFTTLRLTKTGEAADAKNYNEMCFFVRFCVSSA